MSVNNTDNELVVTRSPIDTDKPSSQYATYALSFSSSTPRTSSTSAFSPSATLPAALPPF